MDGAATRPNSLRSWGRFCKADLSEFDTALQADKDVMFTAERLAVESVEVSPKELVELHTQQQDAQEGRAGCNMAGRSLLGFSLFPEGSRLVLRWQQLMLLVDLTYTTFYIPFTLAMLDRNHLHTEEAKITFAVDAVMGAVFCANLLLQLHIPVRVSSSFYQLLVKNARGVAYIYKSKGTLWIDLATVLPWGLQVAVPFLEPESARGVMATVLALRMVRLLRVVNLVKRLARGELGPKSSKHFFQAGSWYLISLCFSAVAIINLLACVWYAVGRSEGAMGDANESWLVSAGGRDLTDASLMTKYLAAVYFTVTTVTTTGYGDIVAHNNTEMVVAIIIMMIGALFMSFIIGTVAGLLNSSSTAAQRSQAFRSKVAYLDRFFATHQTCRAVERDVYLYYYYVWTRCEQEEQEWNEVVAALPNGLRGSMVASVLRHSCGALMEQLGRGVPEAVMLVLCAALERQIMRPGETLAVPGAPADSLWLLRHGTIVAMQQEALVSSALSSYLRADTSMSTTWEGAEQGQQQQLLLLAASKTRSQSAVQAASSSSSAEPQLARPQAAAGGSSPEQDVEAAAAVGSPNAAGRTAAYLKRNRLSMCWPFSKNSSKHHTSMNESRWDPTAAAAADRVLHQLEEQGLLTVATGPCLFPDYALPGCEGAQPAADLQHPVWLRTEGLCVMYRVDSHLVASLCSVCPQLRTNVQKLLKPVVH